MVPACACFTDHVLDALVVDDISTGDSYYVISSAVLGFGVQELFSASAVVGSRGSCWLPHRYAVGQWQSSIHSSVQRQGCRGSDSTRCRLQLGRITRRVSIRHLEHQGSSTRETYRYTNQGRPHACRRGKVPKPIEMLTCGGTYLEPTSSNTSRIASRTYVRQLHRQVGYGCQGGGMC